MAKTCPTPPKVDTRKVGEPVERRDIADLSRFTGRKVMLCAPGDRECQSVAVKKAKRQSGFDPVRPAARLPSTSRPGHPAGFRYTQADSQRNPKTGAAPSAKERKTYGCIQKRDKAGKLKWTGDNAFGVRDPFCTGGSVPCGTDRFKTKNPDRCPVQLIWRKGERHLRFCGVHGKAGRLMPVSTPADALKKAAKACRHWKKHTSWKGYKPLERAELGKL